MARLVPRFARAGTTAVLFIAALAFTLLHGGAADAQNKDAPRSALETKLAYVLTGDRDVDSISKSGLGGLTLFLAQRTALEAGETDRARHRPRRACLLSADLLADRAGLAATFRRKRSSASMPT